MKIIITKQNWKLYALFIALIALILLCLIKISTPKSKTDIKTEYVTKTRVDTFPQFKPQPTKIVYLPAKKYKLHIDTILSHDTVLVDIPIEQKTYHKDSVYHIVISGYEPNLDSIYVFNKTITNTITKTITKRKYSPRINVGIQGGYGYGINSRQFEPYVGIGITWNVFK